MAALDSNRELSEFERKILLLCNEFYETASELFSSAPEEMKRLYDLDDGSTTSPLDVVNHAKKKLSELPYKDRQATREEIDGTRHQARNKGSDSASASDRECGVEKGRRSKRIA